ncbi:hypothetical protein GCM10009633_23290 [Janibacter melonis]
MLDAAPSSVTSERASSSRSSPGASSGTVGLPGAGIADEDDDAGDWEDPASCASPPPQPARRATAARAVAARVEDVVITKGLLATSGVAGSP